MNYFIRSGIFQPQKKNGAKTDHGRRILPRGTYPRYPRAKLTCVDGTSKTGKINFGASLDPPIRTYLRMFQETWKPH